jgi:hypothetical protein
LASNRRKRLQGRFRNKSREHMCPRVGGSTFGFGSLKPAATGALKQKTGANSQDRRQGPNYSTPSKLMVVFVKDTVMIRYISLLGLGLAFVAQPCLAGQGSQHADQASARKAQHHIAKRAPTPVNPTQYDGSWTVSLRGTAGACQGNPVTYNVQVRNGHVVYGGGDSSVTGRVSPSGGVIVRVASGNRVGTVSGRLSRGSGGGTFQAQVGGSACSGSWSAGR